MSRLLIDTNVVIDSIVKTRPQHVLAQEVIGLCNYGGDTGIVSPMSLNDAYYVLRKQYGEATARGLIDRLMALLVIAPVSAEHCDLALHSNEPDFEDGLIRAIAELEDVDFIVTRYKAAFAKSKVRSVTAAEYLEIVS